MDRKSFYLVNAEDDMKLKIVEIEGCTRFRHKLLDMGLKKGSLIKVLHIHKNGSCIINFHKTRLVLGYNMLKRILVEKLG